MSKHFSWSTESGLPLPEHPSIQDRLPLYATALALGQAAHLEYPDVAAHLATCDRCRALLEDVVGMTDAMYDGSVLPSSHYPQPDLSFLSSPTPCSPSSLVAPPSPLRHVVITFAETILASVHTAPHAGFARGRTLYHYHQPAPTRSNLSITIDVFADEHREDSCSIRVGIELLTRDPLDQAASTVCLRAASAQWKGDTDESGYVVFFHVPRSLLPDLIVEITLPA